MKWYLLCQDQVWTEMLGRTERDSLVMAEPPLRPGGEGCGMKFVKLSLFDAGPEHVSDCTWAGWTTQYLSECTCFRRPTRGPLGGVLGVGAFPKKSIRHLGPNERMPIRPPDRFESVRGFVSAYIGFNDGPIEKGKWEPKKGTTPLAYKTDHADFAL